MEEKEKRLLLHLRAEMPRPRRRAARFAGIRTAVGDWEAVVRCFGQNIHEVAHFDNGRQSNDRKRHDFTAMSDLI